MIAHITPVSPITHERWAEFFDLVRKTRRLQIEYRRRLDSRVRRQTEDSELLLDATLASIGTDMTAPAATQSAASEGGAA